MVAVAALDAASQTIGACHPRDKDARVARRIEQTRESVLQPTRTKAPSFCRLLQCSLRFLPPEGAQKSCPPAITEISGKSLYLLQNVAVSYLGLPGLPRAPVLPGLRFYTA